MRQVLSIKKLIGMGFMAFAMFLGAGNLIFPPMIGYLAGEHTWLAAAGFLMTGVGLPLLGIVAISQVGGGFNALAQELPYGLMVFIGSCIFLIIGPLYAVPRTGMVAYEIGVQPFLSHKDSIWFRLVFSLIFFIISWYLALNPGRLLEKIGEWITPALILLLAVLGISPLLTASGATGAPLAQYQSAPVLHGFLEGYLTMDAMAALMFGIVIMTNLQSHGLSEHQALVRYSIFTGIIAATGLALVYISLFYLGATSREMLATPANGGDILIVYVNQLLGHTGNIFLGTIVILACLTTAVGCITAASEYFSELLPSLRYSWIVTVVSIICVLLAALGLNQIIRLFTPVLFLLYPVCISFILLGICKPIIPMPVLVYRATLLVVFMFSLLDVAQMMPFLEAMTGPLSILPGYQQHLSWAIPGATCFVVTFLMGKWLSPESREN